MSEREKNYQERILDWERPGTLAHAALVGKPLLGPEARRILEGMGIDPDLHDEMIREAVKTGGATLSGETIRGKRG